MQSDPPRVKAADRLEQAAALMKEHGHRSIIMVGPRGRARGFVTIERAQSASGAVGEHVEPLPATLSVNEDLRAAVSLMFMHGVTWLACVDGDGFFKGYVTQRSITQLLGETYRGG
jgi:osmoprotectant transport system ATP-binding protein